MKASVLIPLIEQHTGKQGRRMGANVRLLCPAHDDHNPSLDVAEAPDGTALVTCRSHGCSYEEVLRALGFEESSRNGSDDSWTPYGPAVRFYRYTDAGGALLYEVARTTAKQFPQRRPDPSSPSGWRWKLDGVQRVLYRLPEVLAAVAAGETVYVTEGEKDADRLRELGHVATCNPGGAGKWSDTYSEVLAGATVRVIADRDTAGIKHARAVVRSLKAAGVELVLLQPFEEGHDVSDHLDAGRELEELVPVPSPDPLVEQDEEEVKTTPAEDDRRPLDDDGNALRVADRFVGELRFVVGEGYAGWDGTRWHHDNDGAAMRAAREIAEAMRAWAAALAARDGEKAARLVAQHAKRSGSERGLSAMLKIAQSDLRLVLHPERLDADPLLLNALNGTIDLRTGELREHDRADLLTRRVATIYDPAAGAPTWIAFLERVLPSIELRAYMQKAAGAAAIGDNRDELLHVLHGPGGNGKTKFVETIRTALGDYAATAGAELLLAGNRHSAGQPELVRLRGARLLVSSETDEGRRLNVAIVKALTGGDTIAARLLYANEIVEFAPVFSAWVYTNHRPGIPEQSEAIWRRVRLVPFNVTIPKPERDPMLQGKLLAELPGVLRWVVEGARRYLDEGLNPPSLVDAATKGYRADEDLVGRFVADSCKTRPEYLTEAGRLYNAWKTWASEQGEEPRTATWFGTRLSDAGYAPDRLPNGRRGRKGIALRGPLDDVEGS